MRRRTHKRPMAEINVVPYIDVMLVLMIIFMITAPLLTQGVKVNLPQLAAKPITQDQEDPLIVTVDINGLYYLNVGDDQEEGVDHDRLVQRVAAVLRHRPATPILVRGDAAVNYGAVMTAMGLLQQAGADSVGLLTDPLETRGQ